MRQIDHDDVQPLPEPVRKPVLPRPVPGRPNWFFGKNDVPYYVEPPAPPTNVKVVCAGLSPAVLRAVEAVNSWYRSSPSPTSPKGTSP